MAPRAYAFRAMTAADLPMIHDWLTQPHVATWWGDPDEQYALVRDDLGHPAMKQFVVTVDDLSFAYLQCYDPAAWPEGGLGMQPAGARGIDQFIGDPAMVELGHGSTFIRAFVDRLLKNGTPRAVTDPDPDNARAIRAYEKAGFQRKSLVDTCDGPALLMVRDA
jgi:aminoglycoside 6'-N-acetyltransferase